MSKAKHTAGPWQAKSLTDEFLFVKDENGNTLATVWDRNQDLDGSANARLIAEAPTLFSELEVSTSIMESVLHLFGESMAMSTRFGLTSQIESNKELIKKIEG